MSSDDDLFLKTDLSLDEVAEAMARVLSGHVQETRIPGQPCVSIDQVGDYTGWVTIFLRYREDYLNDLHTIEWGSRIHAAIFYSKKLDEAQQAIARILTRELVEHVTWPAILVHDSAWVLAAYDPEHGYREFPAGQVLFTDPYARLWLGPDPSQ
jgi:hypothetical protein